MMLFFIGIIEMLVITIWTKAVAETKVLASGAITVANVMIWYYVLRQIVDNIGDWRLAFLYACGCALGTIIATACFQQAEKRFKAEK